MARRPVRFVAVGGVGLAVRFDIDRPAAAGETTLAHGVSTINGGKASNHAIGAAFFGADTAIISAVGCDAFAPLVRQPLVAHGVDVMGLVEFADAPTMVGTVMVDGRGENYITLAPGALARLAPIDIGAHAATIERADVCVVSLEIAIDAAVEALRIARWRGIPTVLDPAPAPPPARAADLLRFADWVTPNQNEAAAMCGADGSPADHAKMLLELGAAGVVITLGPDGALIATTEWSRRVPVDAIPADRIVDTAGAGDAFTAAFATALASGRDPVEAAAIGCLAGSRICCGPGFVEALDQLRGLVVPVHLTSA